MKKFLVCLLLACSALASSSVFADTSAIINSAIATGQISREEVRALYLMKERRWDDGERVVLFQLPQTNRVHRAFVREVLQMSAEQYAREWDRLVNAGLSTVIHQVASEQEMLARVASTPNALGYLDSNHLIVYSGDKVTIKTLKIID